MPTEFFQQKRQVDAGTILARQEGDREDVKMDIRVRFGEGDSGLEAEVTMWNLKRATWKGVRKNDPLRVKLGWLEGPYTTVLIGTIKDRMTRDDGADTQYIVKGPDAGKERLKLGRSKTFQDPPTSQVAQWIAGQAGLGAGRIVNAGTIEGRWPIIDEHPFSHWLDKLVREAGELSSEKYEWYVEAGKLYFLPKRQPTETAIDIIATERGGNAINVDEAESDKDGKTSDQPDLDFEAYLDPRLTKDGLVNIRTAEYSGIYRVKEYEFNSSTESGDHLMSGTATPPDAEYEIVHSSWSGAQETVRTG